MPFGVNMYDEARLQGRNYANADAVNVVSPGLVTDGLILHLDAGNRTSYASSGTWVDSINGVLAQPVNTPTFSLDGGGSIAFASASSQNYSISTIGMASSLPVATGTSFCFWIKRSGAQSNYNGIIFSRSNLATGINFNVATNNIGYTWNNDANSYNWNSGLTIPDGSWAYCCITIFSGRAVAYLSQASGTTSAVNTISHNISTGNSSFVIGRDTFDNTRYFNGSLAIISIYNIGLSSEQVSQNFNATRTRFGI